MWGLWVLSLVGLLLLSFKKGERGFIAILGYYGVAFWCIFALTLGWPWFYVSAFMFAVLGTYGTYGVIIQRKVEKDVS